MDAGAVSGSLGPHRTGNAFGGRHLGEPRRFSKRHSRPVERRLRCAAGAREGRSGSEGGLIAKDGLTAKGSLHAKGDLAVRSSLAASRAPGWLRGLERDDGRLRRSGSIVRAGLASSGRRPPPGRFPGSGPFASTLKRPSASGHAALIERETAPAEGDWNFCARHLFSRGLSQAPVDARLASCRSMAAMLSFVPTARGPCSSSCARHRVALRRATETT